MVKMFFEPRKEIETDVFFPRVASLGQRKNSASPWEIKPHTFAFWWATARPKTLYGELGSNWVQNHDNYPVYS